MGGWPACVGFILVMQALALGIALAGWRRKPVTAESK
jgi:hypothetical protein